MRKHRIFVSSVQKEMEPERSLALLKLMEQRGSGFSRMKSTMLDHGLDAPEFDMVDGYFQVVLHGPGDDLNRLRLQADTAVALVPPSVEDQLNKRQKKMVDMLVNGEELTSRMCEGIFGITRDTATRNFKKLISSEIATKIGSGRSTRYVLKVKS